MLRKSQCVVGLFAPSCCKIQQLPEHFTLEKD